MSLIQDLPHEIQNRIYELLRHRDLTSLYLTSKSANKNMDIIYLQKLATEFLAKDVYTLYNVYKFKPKEVYDFMNLLIKPTRYGEDHIEYDYNGYSWAVYIAVTLKRIDIVELFSQTPDFRNTINGNWRDLSLQQAVSNRDCAIFRILLRSQEDTPSNWEDIIQTAMNRQDTCILSLILEHHVFKPVIDEATKLSIQEILS